MLNAEACKAVFESDGEALSGLDASASTRLPALIGESPEIRAVLAVVDRIAARDLTVLVTGETGTGKELVGRILHERGARRLGPFVRVNCGAIPPTLAESELFGHVRGAFTGAHASRKGFFAMAHGGTLLLDEVEALPREVQPKVLRALERGEIQTVGSDTIQHVDVRVVACTNIDLPRMVADGGFRADLYYRLAVVELKLPPLRNRTGDIRLLAQHFAAAAARRFGTGARELSSALIAVLESLPWPGNVRQLEHAITSMVALSDQRTLDVHLLDANIALRQTLLMQAVTDEASCTDASSEPTPPSPSTTPSHGRPTLRERMDAIERSIIAQELAACGDNRSEAARRLGVRRTTLLDRMRRLGLRADAAAKPCEPIQP
jgi:transcriptional regulator with GAF, ATPase, and Fis domain